MFSKINRITTKTLRHYDEIGLLKPEHVDKFTGYRYYTTRQLPRLHEILALKQMGLSLQNIKEIMDNPKALELFLKLKEEEIKSNIKMEEMKLLQIKNFASISQGSINIMYTPIIKDIPKIIVASIRKTISNYEELYYISKSIMEKELNRLQCEKFKPNYCFTIYHDGEYKETNIDVEVCERVVSKKVGSGPIKFKELDKVEKAVCILHKGSYSKFREAYAFIFNWIEENDYEIIGSVRESYIDGIWNKENENEWLTEIQVPIKYSLK
ncbi:MerR family transcriptional regulator [Clostridium hydrogenum]|uniref:MerR family transcriptional regulator n=1 Tax=Clostridium hydrogenum TaxID=2855764 RepID=UPI001F161C92|nr:MerR family transcriptional regulator [Clostridium hydrogenum]